MWSLFRKVVDYFVEPIAINVLLWYYFPDLSFIWRVVTIDSTCFSVRYLLNWYNIENKSVTGSTIALPKWTYYGVIVSLYYMSYILTWGHVNMEYMYYSLSLLCVPEVMKALMSYNEDVLECLENYERRMTNYVTSVALAKSINYICIKNLGTDPKLDGKELEGIMSMQNMTYVWTFLKIVLVTTLIKYFKSTNYMWGKVLKTLYDNGNLIEVPKYHRSMVLDTVTMTPKEVIGRVVLKRKWHYLYDPIVLNMILKIYREGEGSMITDLMIMFRRSMGRFVTIWTLADIVPIPITSFMFRLKQKYPYNIVVPIIDVFLVIFYDKNVIMIALFNVIMDYVDTKMLIEMIVLGIRKLQLLVCHNNRYTAHMIMGGISVMIMSRYGYTVLLLPLIGKYNFIYAWYLPLGYFSEYSVLHMITLMMIMYIGVNLIEYEKGMEPPKIDYDLVTSYYRHTMAKLVN
jgi:hypothetical protein